MNKVIKIKNTLIKEDYNTQQNLEKLAQDAFKNYISNYIDKVYTIRGEPSKVIVYIFRGLKPIYGDKLNNFISNYSLSLRLDETIKGNGNFSSQNEFSRGEINIRMSSSLIYHQFLQYYEEYEETKDKDEFIRDIFFATYDSSIMSTLIHELQHAYDSYRSDDKYRSDKKSKDFYKKTNSTGLAGKEDLPAEERDKLRTKYLRLQHEVNARFTQAISDINIHNFNPDTRAQSKYIKPAEYAELFKKAFWGWNEMTPKIQKYLMRRAAQYYHEELEKFKKKGG